MALIQITDLAYAYPGDQDHSILALRGITLRIEEGEHVAVIGANGSGKTTLARHLNALLLPSSGEVKIAGLDTRQRANHPSIRATVGMVFQYPEDQMVATVAGEDVAFGPANLGLPVQEIRRRDALKTVGMWEHRMRPPHLLSAGQMQRLALAGALAMRPRCIVFDETTAMLDPHGRHMVWEIINRLHREGLTIISITHSMEEAAGAGRVVVLHRGEVVLDGSPVAVFNESETLRAVGLDLPPARRVAERLRSVFPGMNAEVLTTAELLTALPQAAHDRVKASQPAAPAAFVQPPPAKVDGRTLIEVSGLGHVYMNGTPLAHRALVDVSLEVAEGGAQGLVGSTGSGKSTLLQHLNGLLRPQKGSVRIGEYDLSRPEVDIRLVRRMAGLVFQLPELQLFEQYVGDEVSYALRQMGMRQTLRQDVRWAMETVGLDFETYKDRLSFQLSGGERRKVTLASVLVMKPSILLLDEPTAGLDPSSRRELLHNLKRLHRRGLTLVISSHQMGDVAALADRVTVLNAGSDVLSGTTREVFSQVVRLNDLGMELPLVTLVAEGLRVRGWQMPTGITSDEVLLEEIERLKSGAL